MLSQLKLKRPIRMILFGAPGVGKGTYGERLCKELNSPIFSTGDYFRKVLKDTSNDDDFTKNLRKTLTSGGLVNDAVVTEVVKRQVEGAKGGLIFDGYPRTLTQLKSLQSMTYIDVILNFTLPDQIIIDKLAGRRVCPTCGRNYNFWEKYDEGYDFTPLKPKSGKDECDDHPGVKLVVRADDTKEVIAGRLKIYREQSDPIIQSMKDSGIVLNFEPKRGVKDYESIRDAVYKFLKSKN